MHQPKRAPTVAGYAKGEQTRERILAAGIAVFGMNGFKGATTRQIADRAGVNLPALQYYFGGKKGLYLACAEAIADRHRQHVGPVGDRVRRALAANPEPDEARRLLRSLFCGLAELLISNRRDEDWSMFVGREMAEPGPGFELLYENLWQPGIQMAADLIARIHGRRQRGAQDLTLSMMMISSLNPFQSGRQVAMRVLGEDSDSASMLDLVCQAMSMQIEQIGSTIDDDE